MTYKNEYKLTQEEIDALINELSDNPMSPVPTPIMSTRECSDCKGTGEYHGLDVIEECQTCQGKGEVL